MELFFVFIFIRLFNKSAYLKTVLIVVGNFFYLSLLSL